MSASLPAISPAVVRAIQELLIADRGMRRPPEKAAKLLALIVELYRKRLPFPPREEVATAIDAAVATVDAALSTRLAEGYIALDVETPQGKVRRRNSIIRERYYRPSKSLIQTVEAAEQREEQHQINIKILKLKRAIAADQRIHLLRPVYDKWRAGHRAVTREGLVDLARELRAVLDRGVG